MCFYVNLFVCFFLFYDGSSRRLVLKRLNRFVVQVWCMRVRGFRNFFKKGGESLFIFV